MKALKIEPGKAPERVNVANELASLQSLVGGYIEVIYPDERRPVGLICNEEGKCCGLELNRALYQNGKPYDIIAGTFLVVGLSAEDFTDLREADAAYRLHHARARVIRLMTRTNPIDEEQDHRCGQAGSQRNSPVCPQAA